MIAEMSMAAAKNNEIPISEDVVRSEFMILFLHLSCHYCHSIAVYRLCCNDTLVLMRGVELGLAGRKRQNTPSYHSKPRSRARETASVRR